MSMLERHGMGGRLEGLGLLLVAGFLFWLMAGGNYWMLFNPRFQWLHVAAAVFLVCCGGLSLAVSRRGSTAWRLGSLALLLVLLLMAGVAIIGFDSFGDTSDGLHGGLTLEAPKSDAPPILEHEGREYIRISPPELFNLAESRPEQALEGRWAMRGLLARLPGAAEGGGLVLVRPFIYCCLADGVAVGFHLGSEGEHPPEQGGWYQVLGRLEKADSSLSLPSDAPLMGAFFSALSQDYLFVPESLEPTAAPSIPYVFSLRSEPPHTW